MEKINFHVHSTGSDGIGTPEQVVLEAINKGFSFICFTDHSKFPTKPKETHGAHHPIYLESLKRIIASTRSFHNSKYIKEVMRLQKDYALKIDIAFGIELDWFKYDLDWMKKLIGSKKHDYVLGSVHAVPLEGIYWPIELGRSGKDKWIQTANQRFGGIENLVKAYYGAMRELVESGLVDCIAHFDLIKMYNKDNDLFQESSKWYRQEVLKTLDTISKSNVAIEINTRGLLKITSAVYPSPWILREASKRNIPITIGTDVHNLSDMDFNYETAINLAKEAGYTAIVRFKARKMIPITLK